MVVIGIRKGGENGEVGVTSQSRHQCVWVKLMCHTAGNARRCVPCGQGQLSDCVGVSDLIDQAYQVNSSSESSLNPKEVKNEDVLHARCFSSVVILMTFLIFSAPFVVLAQQAEMAEARMAAENDAKMDVNGTLWFVGGCLGWVILLGGIITIGAAYTVQPSPPASRLIGKSPEYVAFYTDAYKAKAKSIQTSKAWTGCVVGGIRAC